MTRAVLFRVTWYTMAIWWLLSASPAFAQNAEAEGGVVKILIQIGVAMTIAGLGWLVSRAVGTWDVKYQELGRRVDGQEHLLRLTREEGVRRSEVDAHLRDFRSEQATWRAEFRADLGVVRDELKVVHKDLGEIKSLLHKLGDHRG